MLCRLLPRQGPEMHKFRNTNLSVAVVTGGAAGERSLPDAPPESVPGWVPRRGRNTSLSRPQSSATDRSRAALHPGAASSMQSSQSVAAASSMQPLRVDLPALACSEAASIDATDPLSAGASADCAGESRGLRVDLPPVRGSGNSGTTVQQPTHIASAAADPSYADPSSASVASVAAGPVARGRISVGQLDNQSSHVPQVGRSESGPGSNRSGGRSSCGPWSVGDEREYDIVDIDMETVSGDGPASSSQDIPPLLATAPPIALLGVEGSGASQRDGSLGGGRPVSSAQAPGIPTAGLMEPSTPLAQEIYDEVVHWRKSFFKIPCGSVGKELVNELSSYINKYVQSGGDDTDALFYFSILPVLTLQRTGARCTDKENSGHLQRRMRLWKSKDIQSLLEEGRSLQRSTGGRASGDR
eukprot:scpid60388/ scgid26244/ 